VDGGDHAASERGGGGEENCSLQNDTLNKAYATGSGAVRKNVRSAMALKTLEVMRVWIYPGTETGKMFSSAFYAKCSNNQQKLHR
jgi:hypothetical protein